MSCLMIKWLDYQATQVHIKAKQWEKKRVSAFLHSNENDDDVDEKKTEKHARLRTALFYSFLFYPRVCIFVCLYIYKAVFDLFLMCV
jgi:hypothetical protein